MKLKLIKLAGGMLVLAGITFGSYHGLKGWRFNRDAPVADFPAPANLAEARQQDMQHLALFFDLERSWTQSTLAKARAHYRDLSQRVVTMTDAEFELAVAGLVALADNAHTKVREYNRTPRYSRLPIRGYWFADGYYIIRAYKGFEHLLGYRISAIDGRSFEVVVAQLRQYVGGPEGTFRKYAPYLLESPELMHAAGLTGNADQMEITFATTQGEQQTILLQTPFPPATEQIARAYALLAPRSYSQSQPDWKSIHTQSDKTPLYLQKPIERLHTAQIPELDATYVQFWTNNNVGSTSVKEFCQDALQRYQANPSPVLVIDHRFNGGGNFGLTKECMEDFGHSVPASGHLYIAIGGATFSAGMYSVAFLLQGAGDRATLVGEGVGDRLQHWGEDNLLQLPNSEIEIKFSTGMHDLGKPCTDLGKCHWDALYLDLAIETLEPEIVAPLTYRDYADQIDVVLEAIKRDQSRVAENSN